MIEIYKYDSDNIENILQNMDPKEIDQLAFGAVEVDQTGKVLFYNDKESEITGRKKEDVLGKNFFKEVAPCTQGRLFEGKFKDEVVGSKKSVLFEYVFDYKMTATKVKVHMKPALRGNSYWILVTKF